MGGGVRKAAVDKAGPGRAEDPETRWASGAGQSILVGRVTTGHTWPRGHYHPQAQFSRLSPVQAHSRACYQQHAALPDLPLAQSLYLEVRVLVVSR